MSNIKGTSVGPLHCIRKLRHFKGKKQPLVFLRTLHYCTLSLSSFSDYPTEMFLYIYLYSLLLGPVQQNWTLGFNGRQFSVSNNSSLCDKLCPVCDVLRILQWQHWSKTYHNSTQNLISNIRVHLQVTRELRQKGDPKQWSQGSFL